MKGFYEFLKEIEKELEKDTTLAKDNEFRKEAKDAALNLKILKEELLNAGFELPFVEEMIIEAIRANKNNRS